MVKRYLYCVEHRSTAVYGSSLKQTPFGWVKDALSAGASSMFIQLTNEEFYSWYIWWSIIGGICYQRHPSLYKSSKAYARWLEVIKEQQTVL